MKTAELTGKLLDYWVAQAEGYEWADDVPPQSARGVPAYSTDWVLGGPIIDAQNIFLEPSNYPSDGAVFAYIRDRGEAFYGKFGALRLQAAMRCYVASKFGDEVPGDRAPAQGAAGRSDVDANMEEKEYE